MRGSTFRAARAHRVTPPLRRVFGFPDAEPRVSSFSVIRDQVVEFSCFSVGERPADVRRKGRLADLNAGATLTTADGTLTFSNFQITLPATVGGTANAFAGVDLALFEVEALPAAGFGLRVLEFDIPLVAANDQVGQLLMQYVVTANASVIDGVGLQFTGTALGAGAVTRIDELVSTPAGDVQLQVIREAGGSQIPTAFAALPTPVGEILVNTAITLDVQSRTALFAQVSEIEQSYSVAPVPEPGAFAIFAASIGMITAASRRRWL